MVYCSRPHLYFRSYRLCHLIKPNCNYITSLSALRQWEHEQSSKFDSSISVSKPFWWPNPFWYCKTTFEVVFWLLSYYFLFLTFSCCKATWNVGFWYVKLLFVIKGSCLYSEVLNRHLKLLSDIFSSCLTLFDFLELLVLI